MDPAGTVPRRPNYSIGTILIILYTICVLAVLVCFSGHVIRSDWDARLAIEGDSTLDFNSLNFILLEENQLLQQISEADDQIRGRDAAIAPFEDAVRQAEADHKARELEVEEAIELSRVYLVSARSRMNSTQVAQFDRILPDLNAKELGPWRSGLFFTASLAERDSPPPVAEEKLEDLSTDMPDQQMWQQAATLAEQLVEARKMLILSDLQVAAAHNSLLGALNEQTVILDRKSELEEKLILAKADLTEYPVHRAQWKTLMEDKFVLNPMPWLISAPTIMLTLLATIVAGALGTLVSFSRATFTNGPVTAGQLLIFIGEGIAAAIAVFLFAGAGMLVLSQGGGADGQLELSPFTVAFLAFLSGFMSEQAFEKIREKGWDIFGPGAVATKDPAEPRADGSTPPKPADDKG